MARVITPVPLPKTDDELRLAFAALDSRAAIAAMLGVSDQELIYILYRGGRRYVEFDVPKRAGGSRHISAPTASIKILQKRLNQVLQAVYTVKGAVHGFARERSIVTNADTHIHKRLLLNIDLENFFPSIHFGRVRGTFRSAPYNLPFDVAEVLAQICCHNSSLPQGAPTSPVVSNMVCRAMDTRLRLLAEKCRAVYTRYADDITFSTTRRTFPYQIVSVAPQNAGRLLTLGSELTQIISDSTFTVNTKKVRLRTLGERRDVTGLVVGAGVNVPREFIRRVRGLLHAWEKFGYDAAEAELRARHHRKHRRPGSPEVRLLDVAAGKIEFIRMVRGSSDLLYTKLWNRFASLTDPPRGLKVALVQSRAQVDGALWVLESEDLTVGTAFALDGYGLVSCAHCIGKGVVVAYQPSDAPKQYLVTVTHRCDDRDLVRLRLDRAPAAATALRKGDSTVVKSGDLTVAAGFGNYAPGSTSRLISGYITGKGVRSAVQVFYSDHRAFGGHSGGPVLNSGHAVIGVLQKAVTPDSPGQETVVLPIALIDLIPPVVDGASL